MARKARAVLAVFLALSLIPLPARAAYDDVGTSARVTGMSNAFTAVADDAYSTYYNPAGLATLDRAEFATTYARLLGGLSDGSNIQNSFLSYAQPLDGGRNGTVGAAWNYFTLDTLYREESLFASYGRMLTREDNPSPIYGGFTAKFLNRTLGGTPVAANALNDTGGATNSPDPALQTSSRSNFDADMGVLWRVQPRWTVGLDVQHLFTPNIAFSAGDEDKLGRNVKFGGAYRTPFSTLSSDFDVVEAPDGTMDKDFSVAMEKWLPTLLYGSFAFRGGMAVGTRDFRQLSVGLSYKIHRMQFDYGFSIPVGGLTQTSGNQRVGLTWRFGAPKEADALLGEMLLENLSAAAPVGTPEFNKQAAELVAYKRKAIDLLMRDADSEAQLGRFEDAHQRSRQAASLAPKDGVLADLDERYRTAAAYFPDLSASLRDPAGAAAHDGVMKFIEGKDKEALASLANARALAPSAGLDGMIRVLEAKVGTPAPAVSTATAVAPPPAAVLTSTAPAAAAVAPVPPAEVAVSSSTSGAEALKRILESTSALMDVSFFQQDWDKAAKLAEQVIALDPSNVLAYKRLAGADHAMNKHAEALKALRAAYALEPDESERTQLRAYIAAMKAVVDKETKPRIAAAPKPKAEGSPEDVERMYEAGVELYAQGRLIEAREAFRRCLQIDENYVPAQRAFQRVQAEMMQTGKDQ